MIKKEMNRVETNVTVPTQSKKGEDLIRRREKYTTDSAYEQYVETMRELQQVEQRVDQVNEDPRWLATQTNSC